MPKMSYEEAYRIMAHSTAWLLDRDGDHVPAVNAAVAIGKDYPSMGKQVCAIMGFVAGRAYGIREERERRRKHERKDQNLV